MIYYLVLFFLFALLWSWISEKIHDHYNRKRINEIKTFLNRKYGYNDSDGLVKEEENENLL